MGFSQYEREKLSTIHRQVKQEIHYVDDQTNFGLIEFWAGDDELFKTMRNKGRRYGDCDEFAIEFMLRARAQNFDARLIAVVMDDLSGGHLICEVTNAQHDEACYLDNRFNKPVTIQYLTEYIFLYASPWNPVRGETRKWQRITGFT